MERPALGRALLGLTTLAVATIGLGAPPATGAPTGTTGTAQATGTEEYVVLATEGASDASVRQAVAAAGGQVTEVNDAVGVYVVEAPASGFAESVAASPAVDGAAANESIGQAPADRQQRNEDVETDVVQGSHGSGRGSGWNTRPGHGGGNRPEPLADRQWDMDMIDAPAAHRYGTGDRVRVGIIDTGVDGTHPDIAPNFNGRLSRNFTTDIPEVDGPCEDEPDGSCEDAANVDENGHGTHVAGTVASPRNGVGIAGVAPDAEIVNLRAGQDSGYFFLDSVVQALTYAGDNGIDVVNMSFYIDPWLYNCARNPADAIDDQLEQRTIVAATNRALRYARDHGVTLVGAAGNEHTDLGNPTVDATSPDFPEGAAYERQVDNTCLSMPAEGDGTIAVSSVGPSKLKADYSNYGAEQIEVAAPGGYSRDFFGTPQYGQPTNAILAAYPLGLAQADPRVDPITGASLSPAVVAECRTPGDPATCAYYRYIQGTSMAAPHAAGVAALIVGEQGSRTRDGLGMDPRRVERVLEGTATDTPCPAPVYDYPDQPDSYTAACVGSARFNGWYGDGIVDALAAVRARR